MGSESLVNPAPSAARQGAVAREMLDILGDRWSALVLYALLEGPTRFGDLKVRIDAAGPKRLGRTEISHKMLAETLRGLRRNGLVQRLEPDGQTGAPAYALSLLGLSFRAPLMAVHDWTGRNLDAIESARRRFDQAVSQR
jgi:DNA-binding HxlR family transcriptional regulator